MEEDTIGLGFHARARGGGVAAAAAGPTAFVPASSSSAAAKDSGSGHVVVAEQQQQQQHYCNQQQGEQQAEPPPFPTTTTTDAAPQQIIGRPHQETIQPQSSHAAMAYPPGAFPPPPSQPSTVPSAAHQYPPQQQDYFSSPPPHPSAAMMAQKPPAPQLLTTAPVVPQLSLPYSQPPPQHCFPLPVTQPPPSTRMSPTNAMLEVQQQSMPSFQPPPGLPPGFPSASAVPSFQAPNVDAAPMPQFPAAVALRQSLPTQPLTAVPSVPAHGISSQFHPCRADHQMQQHRQEHHHQQQQQQQQQPQKERQSQSESLEKAQSIAMRFSQEGGDVATYTLARETSSQRSCLAGDGQIMHQQQPQPGQQQQSQAEAMERARAIAMRFRQDAIDDPTILRDVDYAKLRKDHFEKEKRRLRAFALKNLEYVMKHEEGELRKHVDAMNQMSAYEEKQAMQIELMRQQQRQRQLQQEQRKQQGERASMTNKEGGGIGSEGQRRAEQARKRQRHDHNAANSDNGHRSGDAKPLRTSLYLTNLPVDGTTTERTLQSLFCSYGRLDRVTMYRNRSTGKLKGDGLIAFGRDAAEEHYQRMRKGTKGGDDDDDNADLVGTVCAQMNGAELPCGTVIGVQPADMDYKKKESWEKNEERRPKTLPQQAKVVNRRQGTAEMTGKGVSPKGAPATISGRSNEKQDHGDVAATGGTGCDDLDDFFASLE